MKQKRPVWVEIDLDAVAHNVREIRRITSPQAKVMAIVKADGYGHGAEPVARVALENGAERLGVAILSEALALRQAGIQVPILVLGYTPEEQAEEVVAYEITQTVFSDSLAQALSKEAVKLGKTARIHIKLDTGMGRVGIDPEEIVEFVQKISKLANLEIEGMFTHFAIADELDKTYTEGQFTKFMVAVKALEKVGIRLPIYHVCNSAALIDLPQMHLDMVRPGIILYGLYPSAEVKKERIELKPAMGLKAKVGYVKQIAEGTSVSYGRRYIAPEERIVATLPLGYADGLTRLLFAKGGTLIKGERAPLVGRVCMDQCMVDVTHIPGVGVDEEVVLMGCQGARRITAEEIAEQIGTINYEVVCMISKRVPRVYLRNKEK